MNRPVVHVVLYHLAAPFHPAPNGSPRWGSRQQGTLGAVFRRIRLSPSVLDVYTGVLYTQEWKERETEKETERE